MKQLSKVALFLLLTLSCTAIWAQDKVDPVVEAKKQFDSKNYKGALRIYTELLKTDEKNPEYNLKAGLCILSTNIDKSQAHIYLQNYINSSNAINEYYLQLGMALHHALKLDEAIAAFNKYIELYPKKKNEVEQAKLAIQHCGNAKELIKKPLRVSFENLGKKVNSEHADYYPFLPTNESFIVFTTRRPGNTGGVIDADGYYTSEMYITQWKNSSWTKAKGINAKLNTEYDEEVVGLSADGSQMVVYIDHEDTYGDLYLSNYEKNGFGLAVDLGKEINTKHVESAASISSDGSSIVFASFRGEGKGSSDIWQAKRLPDGNWGKATIIEEINTEYGEDFPELSPDGSYILFASQGFNSMGGFDVFKADWDSVAQKYKTPVNLGYPINDTEDNMTVCFMENGRSAYLSTVRADGQGDLDLYRVVFEDVPAKLSVITAGVVAPADTSKEGINAEVVINYLPTGNMQGEYKTYRNGRLAIALDAGKYEMVVTCKGHKTYKKEITVDNRQNYTEIIPMVINLEPLFAAAPKPDPKSKTTDPKAKPAATKPAAKPAAKTVAKPK